MSGPNETAYPQLGADVGEKELLSVFTPTQAEHQFIEDSYTRATVQALLAIQLKVLQRLAPFIAQILARPRSQQPLGSLHFHRPNAQILDASVPVDKIQHRRALQTNSLVKKTRNQLLC